MLASSALNSQDPEAAQAEKDILYLCNASLRATNELTNALHMLVSREDVMELVSKRFHGKVNFNLYDFETICEIHFDGSVWKFVVVDGKDGRIIREQEMSTSGFSLDELSGFIRAIQRAWRNTLMNHRIQIPRRENTNGTIHSASNAG